MGNLSIRNLVIRTLLIRNCLIRYLMIREPIDLESVDRDLSVGICKSGTCWLGTCRSRVPSIRTWQSGTYWSGTSQMEPVDGESVNVELILWGPINLNLLTRNLTIGTSWLGTFCSGVPSVRTYRSGTCLCVVDGLSLWGRLFFSAELQTDPLWRFVSAFSL